MPRRGWQQLDVPSGWVRVLRGPRPKSEQWPRANEHKEVTQQQVAPRPVLPHNRVFGRCFLLSTAEPCAKGRRSSVGHRGGSQVGSRSVGPRRGKRPCEASVESSGSYSIEIQDRTSGQKDRVVQGFLRKRSETSGSFGGSHCEGHGREGRLYAGNFRKRTPFGAVGSTFCRHSNRCSGRCFGVKFVGEDRRSAEERDALLAAATPVLPRPVWMGDGPPLLGNIPPLPSTNVQDVGTWRSWHCCSLRQFCSTDDFQV